MKKILFKTSVRLSDRDRDLLLLAADKLSPSMPELIKLTLADAMNGRRSELSLPALYDAGNNLKPKNLCVKFYEEDREIVEWLKKIISGRRSTVIKGVLREVKKTGSAHLLIWLTNKEEVYENEG